MKKKIIRKRTKILNDIIREEAKSAPDPDENSGFPMIGQTEDLDSRILRRVCDVAAGTADRDKAAVDNYRDTGLWMCDGHHIYDDYPVLRLESLFDCQDDISNQDETAKAAKRLAKKIRSAGLKPLEKGSLQTANDLIRAVYYAPERRELCWNDDDLYIIIRHLVTRGTPRYQTYFPRALEYAWLVIDTYESEIDTKKV